MVVEELPRTAHGKVDRKRLPEPEIVPAVASHVAPRTPVEETLAQIWAEVLHLPRIGIHDNFFDAGGHSLKVMQVVNRVRSAYGINLSVISMFDGPTIAELAETVSAELKCARGALYS